MYHVFLYFQVEHTFLTNIEKLKLLDCLKIIIEDAIFEILILKYKTV